MVVGALCEDIHAFLCTDVAECGIPKLPWLQRESQTAAQPHVRFFYDDVIMQCDRCQAPHNAVVLFLRQLLRHWSYSRRSKSNFCWTCHNFYAVHILSNLLIRCCAVFHWLSVSKFMSRKLSVPGLSTCYENLFLWG
jgi:hypothetical protein